MNNWILWRIRIELYYFFNIFFKSIIFIKKNHDYFVALMKKEFKRIYENK